MKYLNFTAKEILPSLLDKSKTQSIRKAWVELDKLMKPSLAKDSMQKLYDNFGTPTKTAEFKVGDKVELIWEKESDYSIFCIKCLGGIHSRAVSHSCPGKVEATNLAHLPIFSRMLGSVEITEVFKVKIKKESEIRGNQFQLTLDGYQPNGFESQGIVSDKYGFTCVVGVDILAKSDGFKSAYDMFRWIENEWPIYDEKGILVSKGIDLSTLKEFWVYRWKYL